MKVVVFGGSGFLGSHVADVLSNEGYDVHIYDLQQSKYLKQNQKFIKGSVLDKAKVLKAVKNMEIVYNFAALADIKYAQDNPVKAIETNILGNTYILEACRKNNIKRFIFGSTVYVYSEHGSFYRSTKQSAELIIENYQKIYGLDYTILRYGSLYGPRCNNFNFIGRTIHQALLENKIIREGNGDELREYIHIIDAAKASIKILKDEFKNSNIIITGNKSIRVRDMLSMINEILKGKVEIIYTNKTLESHYNITPYTFKPKFAKKLQMNYHNELGQGILDQIYSTYEKLLSEGKIDKSNIFTQD